YVIPLSNNPPQSPLTLRGEAKSVPPLKIRGGEGGVMNPYTHNPQVTDEIMKITKGIGVDVSFEMAGFNSSVNNCLYATRRGGEIILFGIKQGNFVFEDFNRMIVRGFNIHCVIGRQLWQTWEETRALFEDASNGVQEKLWNVMLKQGKGTILRIEDYSKDRFEQMMRDNPKILLQL
ncbi:MAG: zinc-binding dehydrogenase, partial [Patescibacteria group bacterium]